MTNGNHASAKLAGFLQSSNDDRVNWSAKLGTLLQSCKAQKDKTACSQSVTGKGRLQSSVLQSSCKAKKQFINNMLRHFMSNYTFSLSLQIALQCPLTRHCKALANLSFLAKVEEGR